ncbi:MAG: glycosyltransferase family 4 protein [Phycisphaerae bacterium]|nr:glycosyltransferase family 4 protein [Phycisphaerae bacterium]
MRVAILSWESLHSVAVGGVAVHVTELAAALAEKGHQVHVFTRRMPGQRCHDLIADVHYHRCAYPAHQDFVEDVNNMCRSFVDRVFEVEDFVGRFDLVHAHDWLAANAMIWIKQGRGHKCVLTIHATEYARCGNSFPTGRSARIREQERAGTYWADRIIAVSQATKNELMWMYEVPHAKVSAIHNGVNPARFDVTTDPGEDKRRHHIAPLDPTILFCGRLAWQKGPDLLVEAIPSILRARRDAKFVFAGDGDMRPGLEARVRQLGVGAATRFLGRCDGDDLVRLFKLADVVCMPSRNEPFGIVVLEAWSAGKPVVVTQIGGPSEYVWHEVNGLKIEPNPNSVAWGLGMILADFDRARWMGRNGRKAVEESFTWDKIVEQTLVVYKEACPSSAKPAQEIRELLPASRGPGARRRARTDGQTAPLDLMAEVRVEVGHDGEATRHPLTPYRQRLAEIGVPPEQVNGSMILKGRLGTLLAAIESCHQQMHQAGLSRVAYSVQLETSVPPPDEAPCRPGETEEANPAAAP